MDAVATEGGGGECFVTELGPFPYSGNSLLEAFEGRGKWWWWWWWVRSYLAGPGPLLWLLRSMQNPRPHWDQLNQTSWENPEICVFNELGWFESSGAWRLQP